jgi:hypothetical protein
MTPAHKLTAQDNSLAGIDWSAGWDTDAAAHMFARVRELCGVKVGPPELTAEMIATARQEARNVLDEQTEELDAEAQVEFVEADTFAEMCRIADEKQRCKPHDLRIERARALMDDSISLERVWRDLNSTPGRAAESTVEALMYSLRGRGTAALKEPATRRRLGELSDNQLTEVGTRLQRLKPEIARAWTAGEVETLMKLRESSR